MAYSDEFAGRKGVIRIFARDESQEPGLLLQGQGGDWRDPSSQVLDVWYKRWKFRSPVKSMLTQSRH